VLAPLAASDVACPLLSVFTAPTCVPAGATHPTPAVTSAGWHRKNATVPVGVGCPAPPLTVAVSVTAVPGTTPPPLGTDCVTVVDGCFAGLKHSLPGSVWLDGR
jgi:hypothetical protein